jgi:glutamine amidotransferase
MASVALIDYGSGNLRSAEKALARAAREAGTAQDIVVTGDPSAVAAAERIVLPGVGAFGDCMDGLGAIPGMVSALEEAVLARGVPFLGICIGMQLLARVGHEFGDHPGLGWIEGEVVRLRPSPSPLVGEGGRPSRSEDGRKGGEVALKIPHMGWNELNIVQPHPLLEGLGDNPHAYFVHSYEFRAAHRENVFATTDYGGEVVAMIGRGNIAGTQFHPEKSQAVGLALLRNFLAWRP